MGKTNNQLKAFRKGLEDGYKEKLEKEEFKKELKKLGVEWI